MKAYGVDRKDRGCCPGHDKYPPDRYRNDRSRRAHSTARHQAHSRQRARDRVSNASAVADANTLCVPDDEPEDSMLYTAKDKPDDLECLRRRAKLANDDGDPLLCHAIWPEHPVDRVYELIDVQHGHKPFLIRWPADNITTFVAEVREI